MIQYLCDRCSATMKGMSEPLIESAGHLNVNPDICLNGFTLFLPAPVGKAFDVNFRKQHLCAACTGELAKWLQPGKVTR